MKARVGSSQAKMDEVSELGGALRKSRSALIGVGALSALLNVMLLAGSLYMMLVYDSVLPSHSVPTLVGLLILISVIFVFQGAFDVLRSHILMDVGSSIDLALSGRVQSAVATLALRGNTRGDGLTPMRDLDQIRGFLSGPGPSTLFDLPWTLFFLAILYLLHFWLGVTATIGTIVLLILTVITNRTSRDGTRLLAMMASERNAMAESNRRHAEIIHALGMRGRIQARWEGLNSVFLSSNQKLTQINTTLGGASRIFRLFLQSLVLSVGALLVISGDATGGVIFASSILAARALAPVDQAIANWRNFTAARQGWTRLNQLLKQLPEPQQVTLLPAPVEMLAIENIAIVPPGATQTVLSGVTLSLVAGDALGVVGPSASGKSSLLRAIVGIWQPAHGHIRLDGAALDQWDSDLLGAHFGYLPQRVDLLDGTVAENISRFEPAPNAQDIIKAARAATIHDLVLRLPNGYDTMIGADTGELSAGQRQRLGLARALFKDPFLLVLDEPNANLDGEGEVALQAAIASVREREGIVIIVAHQASALVHVNKILYLRAGRMEAFGLRDEVLEKITGRRAIEKSREREVRSG